MSKEINLLPNKGKKSNSQNIEKILWVIAILSLVFVSISSILLFFIKLKSPQSTLKKNEEILISQISRLKLKESQFALLNDRLTSISSIISKRPQFDKSINEIIELIPKDITIVNLSIDQKKLSFTLQTSSLSNVDALMDNIREAINNGKLIKKATFNGITASSQKDQYNFSIDADLL